MASFAWFQDALSRGDEHAPRLGQSHPPARAVEELHAQLLLEPHYLLAESRLGDVPRSAARPKCNSSARVRK
jgi:hypothetical protein